MATTRRLKVADLIQRAIAEYIHVQLRDRIWLGVSIVAVDVSPDLSNARIYYSLLDETQVASIKPLLEKRIPELRHALARSVQLRRVPTLSFVYEGSIKQGQELSRLIDQVIESDEKRRGDAKNDDTN